MAPTYSTVLLAHGEVAPVLLDRRTEGTKKRIVINDFKNKLKNELLENKSGKSAVIGGRVL